MTSSVNPGRPEISVIAPVYLNESTLEELHRRIVAAVDGHTFEMIFVDDSSPDRSAAVLERLARADRRVRTVRLDRNRGEHAAALSGLREARGWWVAMLAADLQDPPEAIPELLARAGEGFDVVFAGRRGRYQSRRRMFSSRLYKTVLSAVSRLPRDAGMFVVMSRQAVQRILAMEGHRPPQVVAMIGSAHLETTSIPVPRSARERGQTAYSHWGRLRNAMWAFRWALRGRSAAAGEEVEAREQK